MVIKRDFTTELRTFRSLEPKLLETNPFRWVLIVGDKLVGIFDSVEEAATTGGREFGIENIFLHEIVPPERISFTPWPVEVVKEC